MRAVGKEIKIALAAEQLSDEGNNVALTQGEDLITHFPLDTSVSSKTAI